MRSAFFVFLVLALFVFWVVAKTAVVVPQQNAYVVERLGRFSGVLDAGFHILVPFVDVIRYRHLLKEQAMDIPEQVCITKDNVQVAVDGILYLKVMDPERASYGISNYTFAITQLAQTTLRSEIGKIDLDRTFEERTYVNTQVVTEVDKASEAWGVKVLRYEIKNITPPQDILAAMEKQMRAEREKRAVVLQSEGERDAAINSARARSSRSSRPRRPRKQQQINEAEGQASAIQAVAKATADGIRSVAEAIRAEGGFEAVQLRVAEQYITQFGHLARAGNSLVIPSNLSDVGSMIALAMNVIQAEGHAPAAARSGARASRLRHPRPLRHSPARSARSSGPHRTPRSVQRWLHALPYNYERQREDAAILPGRHPPPHRALPGGGARRGDDPRAARLPAAAPELRDPWTASTT